MTTPKLKRALVTERSHFAGAENAREAAVRSGGFT